MKINNLSLPHPVLGLADDVIGEYHANCDVKLEKEKISISVLHNIFHETIKKEIASGNLKYCVDINCPKTMYRKTFLSENTKQLIEIESVELIDKVVLSFFVISKKYYTDYSITGLNNDYGEQKFEISKGDVVAYGGETFFIAGKKWEEWKSVSNLILIYEGEKNQGPYQVDLDSDKISIYLSKNDYKSFRDSYHSGFNAILHSSIVLPTLIYALNQMINDKDSYENNRWCQVLEFRKNNDSILSKKDWSPEIAFELAQKILGNPLSRTFEKINKIIDNSLEEN